MPYTIIAILFIICYFYFDKSRYKLFAASSAILVFFYGLALDLYESPAMDSFFKNYKPKIGFITYSYFAMTLIALFISNLLVYFYYNPNTYEKQQKKYSTRKLKLAFYLLTLFSFIGLMINLWHVYSSGNTIQQMVIDPRTYEYTFGKSVIINYIYFLNIPAILVFIYIRQVDHEKVKFGRLLVFFLVLISGFHGIKYTIFDTILIPLMFFLLLNKNIKFAYSFLVLGLLLFVYTIFSQFVRGGYYDSKLMNLASYILPNYYNLFYDIEYYPNQFTPFYNLFVPDKILGQIPHTFVFNPGVNGEFSISPSFNMYTALDFLYIDFNLLGPFFFIPIFLCGIYFYNIKNKNIIIVYFLSTLFYNLIMCFYTYAFIKIKYSYYIIIFIIIHLLCQKNSQQKTILSKENT